MTFRRAARVWSNRENCKDFGSKLSNSIFPRHWISSSSTFSGGPVTRSKRTHQWMSGVTMLVRWLCSFPASELLALVDPLVLPRPQENTPLGNQGTREPTGCTIFKKQRKQVMSGGLAVTGLGKECTLTPSIRSESELLDLHVHRGPCPKFQETAEG